MAQFQEVLQTLRDKANNPPEQGALFERLMLAYLKQDPTRNFADVCSYQNWAQRQTLMGRDARDLGIDLVAQDKDGRHHAIQCKFYNEDTTIQKADVDSFLLDSARPNIFASRLLVHTAGNISTNVDKAVANQQPIFQKLGPDELTAASVNWDFIDPTKTKVIQKRYELRHHQQEALEKTLQGFKTADRGKVIMACGTGKTLLALHIAEKQAPPTGGHVLVLMPSIALMSQLLREWAWQRHRDHRYFAICSDRQVGKDEDMHIEDLSIPATTNSKHFYEHIIQPSKRLTVVFSTYQSIDKVSEAQRMGAPEYDLVICDEAHRTTGVDLIDTPASKGTLFTRIHNPQFLKAKKRLYMTATSRVYTDTVQTQAKDRNAYVFSMDNKDHYGEEFYHLAFSQAIKKGLLSDYKVIVLAVEQRYVDQVMQDAFTDDGDVRLDDIARITGCHKFLSGKGLKNKQMKPLSRAVSFSSTIKGSKTICEKFSQAVQSLNEFEEANPEDTFECELDHVDGSYPAPQRSKKLNWLREDAGDYHCRILSNAKCLTEGVDVPSLDAVIFMNPKKSQIDVVQAVGRVMRKAPDKECGYVILPVVIPAGKTPEESLDDNKAYSVVWQVLRALRSHDDRLEFSINSLDLTDSKIPIETEVIGGSAKEPVVEKVVGKVVGQLELEGLDVYTKALYAKIVDKVGDRKYWSHWAKEIADEFETIKLRIEGLLDRNKHAHSAFKRFMQGLRSSINEGVSEGAGISMLAQQIITRPIFNALFSDYEFSSKNPISQSIEKMLATLEKHGLQHEIKDRQNFYDDVRQTIGSIEDAAGRQRILKELYENFFKTIIEKEAQSLGIAYTPNELVDFVLYSANEILQDEFGLGLTDEGVNILEPFVGTGTFLVQLLQNQQLIKSQDIERKFTKEMFASEILLLAYYIASVNIEQAYHARNKAGYKPFEGIALADTFNQFERDDDFASTWFPENNARLKRQKEAPLKVIISNPPWSVGQRSENDANKNVKYEKLDKKIRRTYVAKSNVTAKNALYDSYIRAIRWASDRLGKKGIIGFVTNAGFLDGRSTSGLRKCLIDEFDSIWCFNLRGNARTKGEQRRKEKDNVFGQNTRASVAITLLVKNPHKPIKEAKVHYCDIGDYLTRTEKLNKITEAKSIKGKQLKWRTIKPDKRGDWINQSDPAFEKFIPLGRKETKGKINAETIFRTYSRGIITSRDAWAYNFSRSEVAQNMERMIDFYNEQLKASHQTNSQISKLDIEQFIDNDPQKISWDSALKNSFANRKKGGFLASKIRSSVYRPFTKEHLYFDRQFNNSVHRMPGFFPQADSKNLLIGVTDRGASSFSTLMVDMVLDVGVLSPAQAFPRYVYRQNEDNNAASLALAMESGGGGGAVYKRDDNITPFALQTFRKHYKDKNISADDIFYYVYGVLHSPEYCTRFENNLNKELPRIPLSPNFKEFSEIGKQLANIHLNYENAEESLTILSSDGEPWLSDSLLQAQDYRVEKMRFLSKKDKSKIIFNDKIMLANIPQEAYEYTICGRSAIEWVMDRYRVKIDKDSKIKNDPNDWGGEENPQYIVSLVRKIATVSVQSVKLINALPELGA